ncbi:MAG: cysteine desulfurase CsdA [Rhodothermaeota bacterium MED-G19]|nr:MAG: cysteine desulfurase CsdA [Rhodothermaeota bacterium MED-G19]
MNSFPINSIRKDFPILKSKINNHDLVYFDNAATTQKPQSVIDSISNYYEKYNSNIHRGVHSLAEKATNEFEKTRTKIKKFINAKSNTEIVFTRGTTEGINLISSSLGKYKFSEGDEIIISEMEHHSNIVPWQMIAKEKNLKLNMINVTDEGKIDLNDFKNIISSKTKLVSLVHISNTLGTVNPIKEIVEICNTNNIISVIDGAQASAHSVIDVQNINCDFYVLSAHKMYGPTGVGVVYGKEKLLEEMPPYMGGGEMIKEVKFSGTSYNDLPYKFEAGTPNIGDVIGFKEAINYIENLGKDQIIQYEDKLRDYAQKELNSIDGFRIIGNSENKIGIFSFTIENFHYYDLGLLLDAKGIAVRTGHHCTQPLMDKYNLDGTARVSLALYNTEEEVDFFVDSVKNLLNR